MLLKKIWSIVFVVVFSFFILSCYEKTQSSGNVQSGPIMGYDKVKWGSSIANVREAYNLGDEVVLYRSSDDPNIVFLRQENISENIVKREFYFNKWNANDYILYRVWVHYREEKNSQNIVTSLINTLQGIYGPVTHSYEERGKTRAMFGMTASELTTYIIFGKYEPDLEVAIVNERTSGTAWVQTMQSDNNKVRYTWKKYRDSYEAQRLGL